VNVIFKKKFTKRLLKSIPGGAHTYSKGADQFPANAPEILCSGKGAYVYDDKKKKYLDYGMGLRSVLLGYANPLVNKAAFKEINKGNNLTRPSLIELKAAEKFNSIIKKSQMVKFTKNGSAAVTAAVKLARAYTKKKIVLRCAQHPFFSYDDWFIGSTNIKKGIPKETINLTKNFNYNDFDSLKILINKYRNKIACVILEPAATECPSNSKINLQNCCGVYPCNRNYNKKTNFIKKVQYICKVNKIIFILDEMITGFRWSLGGAQKVMDLDPDLSTFGKAMANGFSLAALCGKKKIMSLGSIEKKNEERVFLLSTTHGAEMGPLGAFIKTVDLIKSNNVIEHIWKFGEQLIVKANEISKNKNINDFFYFTGPACSPSYYCKNIKKKLDAD
jgi:glutamate-1-semialdehyde 2,1-aminomutase